MVSYIFRFKRNKINPLGLVFHIAIIYQQRICLHRRMVHVTYWKTPMVNSGSTSYWLIQWNYFIDLSQLDESYSRLAGFASSPDGTTCWARHGISCSHNSIINCFLMCQRSLKQYMARRKVNNAILFVQTKITIIVIIIHHYHQKALL